MIDGLAVVDYEAIDRATPAAAARCPTGAIRWVEGAQELRLEPVLSGSVT